MSFAFFFPGQGSQSLNMMAGFDGVSVVRQTFEQASAALGEDLWAMMNGEDAALIGQTVNTQPLMLAAGVATYRAYLEAGGKPPAAVAGHSLGEYSALVAAGSLDFADAVRQICAAAAQGQVAEAVNFNSPGQVVIAGDAVAVERAMAAAKEAGAKRALPLPVSVPSHCSLMKPAAEKLAAALQNVALNAPQIRVINNVDVASYTDPAQIKDALVRQLYSPVRWTETVALLVREGITESAECGPGKVLAGLAKRIDKAAVCAALTSQEAVDAFIAAH